MFPQANTICLINVSDFLMGSAVELDSEGERDRDKEERKKRKKDRSRSKERDKERSRSKGRERSKDREKKKHKKHKKEKKKHKKREKSSEGDDTANEGGDTPDAKTPTGRDQNRDKTPELPEIDKLPGLGKYDSDAEGEEGEIEEKKMEIDRERRKEHGRDEEKKQDRKEYQRDDKQGGRDKRETSRERDRKRRSRSRERRRSGERGRDRDRDGRENTLRSDREGRDISSRGEKDSKDRERNRKEKGENKEEPGELSGGKEVLSLSIEETNKLRAKLGLKPLNVSTIEMEDETPDLPGELIPGDRDKTRHLVPQHWGERDQQKKLVERLGIKKDLRKVKTKLAVVKGLGESDSDDDDAGKWVERQKKKVKEKEEAEKRAKAMAELDEEFGVQDIVEEGMKNKQQEEYTSKNLKGMRVEHKAEAFGEADTVLTLQ